jgi:hypothetical protein
LGAATACHLSILSLLEREARRLGARCLACDVLDTNEVVKALVALPRNQFEFRKA